MTKEDFNLWLKKRCETQSKLLMGAIGGMITIGLIAFLVQGGLLYLIFWAASGHLLAFPVVAGLFGGIGYFTWMTAPKMLCDDEYEVETDDGDITVGIAPSISSAWTFAMGSRDSDISILERVAGMFMIVPRMFWTALYLKKRNEDVQKIDVRECGAILRFALKKAERVGVEEIMDKRPKTNLSKTMREVSLIDGVVFLVRNGLGLTLANRFKQDVETGVPKVAAERSAAG